MAASTEISDDSLLLYHMDSSFYSAKVRVALALKGLSYQKQSVSLSAQENLQPWFMRLNPACEVPVLVHNGKVIPDSSRIIDYLDTVFEDKGTRLAPPEDTDLGRRVRHFRDLLDPLPVPLYTFGPVFHPDLADSPIPESLRMQAHHMMSTSRGLVQHLRDLAATNPDVVEAYGRKAENIERALQDRSVIQKVLNDLEVTLDEVEKELEERKVEQQASGQQQWLCGESFTAADIMLSCLLFRLKSVGLAHRSTQKRHLLEAYYLQATDFAPFKAEMVPI